MRWGKALAIAREWELAGLHLKSAAREIQTLEEYWALFLADLIARSLKVPVNALTVKVGTGTTQSRLFGYMED